MASPDIKDVQRGYVIPIGGAEEKTDNPEILQKFVDLAGGKDAVISVIPTASQLSDTGERYQAIFKELGAGTTHSLPIDDRADAKKPEYLELLETSTAIFITGGNQLRLSTILGGTPIAQAVSKLNACVVHYAGTSAGAAIVSQHMIIGGATGVVPTEGAPKGLRGVACTTAPRPPHELVIWSSKLAFPSAYKASEGPQSTHNHPCL